MSIYELISLVKLYSQVFSRTNFTITEAELETASEALKELSDNRSDWTPQQKETYKAMVDFVKEQSQRQQHD